MVREGGGQRLQGAMRVEYVPFHGHEGSVNPFQSRVGTFIARPVKATMEVNLLQSYLAYKTAKLTHTMAVEASIVLILHTINLVEVTTKESRTISNGS
jgi:predicted ferric reductase